MYLSETPSFFLPLERIKVRRDDRQRRDFTTEDLEHSFRERGQLQPIIVRDLGDGDYELVAGERRFTAASKIGWTQIECKETAVLSTLELKLLELEENIKRKDLTWAEHLASVEQLHHLYLELDSDWTQQQTAEAIGLAEGHVSEYLRVAAEAKARPELLERKTLRESYNVIKRNDSRKMGKALEDLFAGVKNIIAPEAKDALDNQEAAAAEAKAEAEAQAKEEILNESFLDWAPQYTGERFNLLHMDFPYGVELFSKEFGQRGGGKAYADSKDVYFALLNCLLDNLENFFAASGHIMFWYSLKYDRETRELFRQKAPSLEITTWPIIWHKTDNAGIIGDARRDYRHIYEAALFARRGERQLVRSVADVYGAPTDRALHPSTKPEPMLRHFMSSLVDEHTSLFDPTCGSGTALRAADSLGANRVLGLEIDLEVCEAARVALRNARRLRAASTNIRSL